MILIKKILLLFTLLRIVSGSDTFHPTPDREYDLLHSVIDIYIDLSARSVEGNVTHTLSLLSGQIDSISFNSKNINVRSISIDGNNSKSFEVTKNKLIIPLDRDYNLDDLLTVSVEYDAEPKLGCFFVQPDSVYPENICRHGLRANRCTTSTGFPFMTIQMIEVLLSVFSLLILPLWPFLTVL